MDAAKAAGDQRVANVNAELDEASKATAHAEAKAKAILSRPAPTGDQCEAADALIREEVQ